MAYSARLLSAKACTPCFFQISTSRLFADVLRLFQISALCTSFFKRSTAREAREDSSQWSNFKISYRLHQSFIFNHFQSFSLILLFLSFSYFQMFPSRHDSNQSIDVLFQPRLKPICVLFQTRLKSIIPVLSSRHDSNQSLYLQCFYRPDAQSSSRESIDQASIRCLRRAVTRDASSAGSTLSTGTSSWHLGSSGWVDGWQN